MTTVAERKPGTGMGRKPAHIYQGATGHELPHEAIWVAIRQLRAFTTRELCSRLVKNKVSGVNDDTIKAYLQRLAFGGYISREPLEDDNRIKRMQNAGYRYTLVNDCGVEAPRLNADGKETLQGRGTENMWRTMKALKSFDYRELANASSTERVSVAPATAKRYLMHLSAAGYLIEVKPATSNTPARYTLRASKNTGPKPPMVQRTHHVYDPNLKKIMWREGEA